MGTTSVQKRLEFGVVGAGRIGTVHARTLAWRVPNANVRAIADPRPGAAKVLADEVGVERVSEDYRAVIEDPVIDAVVVCSSTDTHAAIVTTAARAGKHVFCEKPLELSVERTREVLETVADTGVKLQLGFNRRFDPDFRRVRELVAEGAIGEPHLLRITSRDPAPPPLDYIRVSGGMFLDMTIHDFDMARFVMGREVEEIHVAAAVLVDPAIGAAGDVDTAVITLRFEGGALGTIDNSRRAVYGYDQRLEVLGAEGMVSNGNRSPHSACVWSGSGVHGPLPLNFFMERYADAYAAEMQSFVDCILRDRAPEADGADGLAALMMGFAAQRSLEEGRPVRLDEVLAPRAALTA